MGDFNIYVQRENCDSNYYPTGSIKSIELLCDLTLLHTGPMRVNINSSTTIDCITSIPELHFHTEVTYAISSDHMSIYSVINLNEPVRQSKYIIFRSFKHFNIVNCVYDLDKSCILKNLHTYCFDITHAWSLWKQAYLEICNRHAPIIKRRVKNRTILGLMKKLWN